MFLFDQVCEDEPTTCVPLLFFMSHLSYLVLNEITLFYSSLSTTKTSQTGKIQNWTAQVAKANKKSKVPAPSQGTAPSTTVVRTTTTSSAVVSQTAPTSKKKAKPESQAGAVKLGYSEFLDEDESVERNAALTSPIKGRKRLTTKVCYSSQFKLLNCQFATELGHGQRRRIVTITKAHFGRQEVYKF